MHIFNNSILGVFLQRNIILCDKSSQSSFRTCLVTAGSAALHCYSNLPVLESTLFTLLYCSQYEGVSKIFHTDAVKILKLAIRPIGRRHPRSSSLPHVDTVPTYSSIFGTFPVSPFLSECQALSAIWPVSPPWYQTGVLSASISFLEVGRSHRVPNQGSMLGGG